MRGGVCGVASSAEAARRRPTALRGIQLLICRGGGSCVENRRGDGGVEVRLTQVGGWENTAGIGGGRCRAGLGGAFASVLYKCYSIGHVFLDIF